MITIRLQTLGPPRVVRLNDGTESEVRDIIYSAALWAADSLLLKGAPAADAPCCPRCHAQAAMHLTTALIALNTCEYVCPTEGCSNYLFPALGWEGPG